MGGDTSNITAQLSSDMNKQVTVGFSDQVVGEVFDDQTVNDTSFNSDNTSSMDIGSYLTRPVLIHSQSWAEGTNVADVISPWHLYFNSPAIKRKLENFAFLRCKLHLKVVINSSPFYYGQLLVSYKPLIGFTGADSLPIDDARIVPRSTRPHIWCYPSNSQGGEMVLPFLYHQNWLPIRTSTEVTNMGTLNIDSTDILRNANSVVGGIVDIKVYAWGEDVKVAGPTLNSVLMAKTRKMRKREIEELSMFDSLDVNGKKRPRNELRKLFEESGIVIETLPEAAQEFFNSEAEPQSGRRKMTRKEVDEYGEEADSGKPSAALGIISKGFGKLSNVPIIGPFAKASSTVAGVASSVLGFFGFSNVPNISNVSMYLPSALPQLASSEISVPMERLTFDPKNELTIDNTVVGGTSQDELAIKNLVTRESYLANTVWQASDATDQLLFATDVHPAIVRNSNVGANLVTVGTPLSHFSNLFKYWRGDIIFKFRFVCSAYHRGRVRIIWDPAGYVPAGGYAEVINEVVDISETPEIEIKVPYLAASTFLETQYNELTNYGLRSYVTSFNPKIHNGVLSMFVLNPQTSPVSSADISVVISVRAGEKFEFAAPKELPNTLQFYLQSHSRSMSDKEVLELKEFMAKPQSGDLDYEPTQIELFDRGEDPDQLYSVYMGESIQSLRTLLRRSTFTMTLTKSTDPASTANMNFVKYFFNRLPLYYGYDPNGVHNTFAALKFNYVKNVPFNWIGSCFVGNRGSIYWRAAPSSSYFINRVSIERADTIIVSGDYDGNFMLSYNSTASSSTRAHTIMGCNSSAYNGRSHINQATISCLNVDVPFYNQYRMRSNNPLTRTLGTSYDNSDRDTVALNIDLHRNTGEIPSNTIVHLYSSIGTDFQFCYFLNVPILLRAGLPTPTP